MISQTDRQTDRQTEHELTGFPSVDKPWLKYYSEEAINAELPECTMYDFVYKNNKDHLDDIAIEYMGNRITYKELFEKTDRIIKEFLSIGLRPGMFVCICSVILPEVIYSMYALSAIGAVANFIDPRTDKHQMKKMMADTYAKYMISLDLVSEKVKEAVSDTEIEKIILISPADSLKRDKKLLYRITNKNISTAGCLKWSELFEKSEKEAEPILTNGKNVCVMTYTSGTTGMPKGVMLTNNNVNAVAFQYKYGMEYKRQQRYLSMIPPFIVYGICVAVHLPISLGITCVLIPKFEPEKLYSYLKKYRPNQVTCPPSNFEILLKENKKIDLSYLTVPAVGADFWTEKFEKKFNQYLKEHNSPANLIKGYGMTEVSSSSCTTFKGCDKLGSVGIPLLKMTIAIFEPGTEREVPYRTEGEICFSGPNVMKGYYNNIEQTKEILREHKDGKLWIHSGDIGMMDEDGFLYVIDRIKRIIDTKDGRKILPSKVEKVIREMPGVSKCVVVSGNLDRGYVLRAFVVLEDENLKINKIKRDLEEQLPKWMLPVLVEQISDLPLTPVGKVDYLALEKIE